MLSEHDKELLRTCAFAIVYPELSSGVDLYEMTDELFRARGNQVLQELAQWVESYSQRKRTVRMADPALFANPNSVWTLYLAACDISTPEGVVTAPSDDTSLWTIGPYEDGLTEQTRATPEEVAKARNRAKIQRRRTEQKTVGKATTQQFLDSLLGGLRERIEVITDDGIKKDAEYALEFSPGIENIAAACAALGISFEELVRGVLPK